MVEGGLRCYQRCRGTYLLNLQRITADRDPLLEKQDNATGAIIHLSAAFRLWTRASDAICRIAEKQPSSNASTLGLEDPFLVTPNPRRPKGVDEPAKDESGPTPSQAAHFSGKHLHNLQWHVAYGLLDVTFDLASAYAARGSVRDAEYFLKVAGLVSETIKSGSMGAKVGTREAELLFRLRKLEEVGTRLESAAGLLCTVSFTFGYLKYSTGVDRDFL